MTLRAARTERRSAIKRSRDEKAALFKQVLPCSSGVGIGVGRRGEEERSGMLRSLWASHQIVCNSAARIFPSRLITGTLCRRPVAATILSGRSGT